MTTRRPANLVLPLSDAKLRLRHKTKIYGKPEGFSFTPKKRESIAEVRKVSVKDVLTFVSKGPEDENFESTAEFLNQVSRFLHGVVDKQDKDLNESVIQRCFPFVVHDEPQIRAMAFRLIRFSVHRESQLQKLLLSQLDVMLVRSLDFSELEQEKEEAFKLICKLLFLYRDSALKKFIKEEDSNFTLFPKSVLKSIITIALDRLPRILDIVDERKPEKLFLPALGILVDLAVEDPELVLKCAGTEWIVRSVVVLGADNSNVSSLVCKVLLKWMDTADLREKARIGLVIEQIFSPLIDLGFFHQKIQDPKKGDPPQVKVSQILESVSTIFLSIIRSWTGILACGAIDETGELISSSPFKLLSFLGLGTAFNPTMLQIRDMVIGICCEFVDMPYASKKFSDWSEALVFYAKMHLPDKYKTSLRDDFVVGEIEALQTSGIMNPDIVDCLMSFRAVACYVLIEAGLPQALARLIMARPDDPMSIKATLLLADLLKSGATFLPEEKKLMLLSVPTVIQAASERTQMSAKTANGIFPTSPLTFPNSDNAMILIHRLDQLNDTGLNRLALESELIQIELFVKGGEFLFCKNDIRKRTWSTLDSDERFEKLITVEHDFFSRSTSKDLNLDNLESIVAHLEAENSIIMKKYRHNDRLHSFFSKIFTIIFPSNARFVTDTVTFTANIVKSLCRTVRLVVPLAKMEPHYGELIEKFLNQTKEQLDPEVLYKGIFSPKNILNNGSRYYFAILAAIGSLSIGIQMIEESGIYQIFLDLLLSTTSIEYIKLIVSSLNYSNPGITRLILETALTATDDQSRKWCTRFLGVLAGSNVIPDFEKYGMKLLISQLGDSNVKVVRHAVRLLHVWLPKYPAALDILARTSLEPLGSAGILLKAHLFGSEKLVQAMEEDAKEALEYWMENYQKEYVNIIEEDMRAALLNVRRSIDGSFARPSSEKFEKFGVPMPVHIFSQLASHQVGRSMLVDASIPSKLLKTLIESGVVEEDEILDVKAALLSIGHISSNLPNGMIEVMFPAETIPIVCRYAEECPTLSVRGTAIWALNLVGKSEDGARILASLGWESNRHVHVIDQVCEEFCERIKSKSQSRRPSRIGYRWINCIDGSKQNMRKSLSSSDLSNEEQSTWKKQNSLNQEGSSPIALERRRLHSDSRLDLPFLFLKKGHRKHEKLTATKSMPQSSDEVRPDRTFTHESAVTSGFGSVSQDEAKQTESMTDLPPPSLPQLDQRTEFFSKLDEPKDPKRRFPFAPSTLPDFINPVVPNTLPFSLGFGESSALAVSFESEKSDHLPEMASVDRRRVALSELRNQPHFSALYRKHYGIQGFDQECILTIPNRTHSHVYYSFLSKAEMKNIEKYERILTAAGEWVPTEPLPDGPKAMATVVGWTVVSLPSEVGLICKNIFKSIRKTRTIEDSGSLERSSAHRCFYCSRRIAKGLSTNHFHSLDSKMRTDVLEFVSLFEIRANALQKSLTKKYGRQLQTCFENPCLYSDALELLADLNYSRKSRREIHKIFSKAIGFFPANYG